MPQFFKLPEASPPVRSSELLKQLDENLKQIRERSRQIQKQIVESRRGKDGLPVQYQAGDFILHNRLENPNDLMPSK